MALRQRRCRERPITAWRPQPNGSSPGDGRESGARGAHSCDFAFGEDDVFTTVELPDNKTAAAVALAINSTGHTSVRTVVLMTPEEIDAAASQTVNYTPPGA
jgi:hypothetical protein